MSKNLDIINFVVSLIIKAVVIPFLSNQSHQPISRTRKSPFPRASKRQNSSKFHLFQELENTLISGWHLGRVDVKQSVRGRLKARPNGGASPTLRTKGKPRWFSPSGLINLGDDLLSPIERFRNCASTERFDMFVEGAFISSVP